MENINKAFENATDRICERCVAKRQCELTKTKCAEWETLSAIRDELNHANEVLEECDKLTADIETKEKAWLEQGVCPYCKQELPNEQGSI